MLQVLHTPQGPLQLQLEVEKAIALHRYEIFGNFMLYVHILKMGFDVITEILLCICRWMGDSAFHCISLQVTMKLKSRQFLSVCRHSNFGWRIVCADPVPLSTMRIIFLAMGLLCLVGYVFGYSPPRVSNNEEFKFATLKKFQNLLEILRRPSAVNLDKQTLSDEIVEEANRIVGGTPALVGEFPYQAALNLTNRFCGGTLISTSIVLTAAHCLYGLSDASTGTFTVTVNTTEITGGIGAVRRGVRKFVRHASFNPDTFDNDIALLALNSPITNVRLAKLPLAYTTSTYAGQRAVIVGWGTTSEGGTLSHNLLKADVTVLTNTACNLQHNNTITSNMVCAAAPGRDACQGDSGGPMLVEGVQIGITSFGMGCADPRFPGVYTRVTRYLSWIKTVASSLSPSTTVPVY